jgi:hypothetical protein
MQKMAIFTLKSRSLASELLLTGIYELLRLTTEFINHVNTVSLMQFALSTVCNYVSSKTGYITVKSQLTPSTIEIQFFLFLKIITHVTVFELYIVFQLLKI